MARDRPLVQGNEAYLRYNLLARHSSEIQVDRQLFYPTCASRGVQYVF